ncbi:MAG: rhodanese-like domain-containing protein [Planctomycetaceae bacterium]|nr:rhodanese-like domain-containing protein [Planctomycetaceae bacterium]
MKSHQNLLFILLAGLASAAFAQEPLTHTKDSLDTVKENVKAGKAVIVDVREQEEWDAGHLKGAVLMPQSKLKVEAEAAELAKKLDKSKVIYTHCRAGRRALACGEILKKQGFDVRPLKAGFDELVKAGFEKAEK